MANEVGIAKNVVGVLSEIFSQGSTLDDVSNIIRVSGTLASTLPFVGAVLVLIGDFLPGGKDEEIRRGFKELGNKIDQVRNDIEDLKNDMTWKLTMLQYSKDEVVIESGMHSWFEIARASGKDEKLMHMNDLKEHCGGKKCSDALDSLLGGVNGNRLFSISILDSFYDKTGGHRRNISALATRLLQLVCGGMVVVSTYETMVHNKTGADKFITKYDSQWKNARVNVRSVVDRCVQNFEDNMLKDLNKKLDGGGSNERLVSEISAFMSDKYDWLENFCLVYDEVYGSDKHWIHGYFVNSFRRNGKCGIVFYRTKGQAPRFSSSYNDAYEIVNNAYCYDAKDCNERIVAKIDEKGIGWVGCAVIQRDSNPRYRDAFSTWVVDINRSQKLGFWSNSWLKTYKAILLLK